MLSETHEASAGGISYLSLNRALKLRFSLKTRMINLLVIMYCLFSRGVLHALYAAETSIQFSVVCISVDHVDHSRVFVLYQLPDYLASSRLQHTTLTSTINFTGRPTCTHNYVYTVTIVIFY